MDKRNSNKGFSLVETIIVIAIMAVLVAIAVPTYIKYVQESRTTVCQTNMQELVRAYQVENAFEGVPDLHVEARYDLIDRVATTDFACKLKEGTEHTYLGFCPGGGEYTVAIDGDGFLIITCSKHGAFKANSIGFIKTLLSTAESLQLDGKNNLQAYLATKDKTIDSTSGDNSNYYKFIRDELTKAYGINPNSYTWAIKNVGGSLVVLQTATDITAMPLGSEVAVTMYSAKTGKYSTATVSVGTTTATNGKVTTTYNVLDFNSIKNVSAIDD